jgi:hypothetical protein
LRFQAQQWKTDTIKYHAAAGEIWLKVGHCVTPVIQKKNTMCPFTLSLSKWA